MHTCIHARMHRHQGTDLHQPSNDVTFSVQTLLQELTPLALVAFLLLLKVFVAFFAGYCLPFMLPFVC